MIELKKGDKIKLTFRDSRGHKRLIDENNGLFIISDDSPYDYRLFYVEGHQNSLTKEYYGIDILNTVYELPEELFKI